MLDLKAFMYYFENYVDENEDLKTVVFVTDYTEILSLQLDSKLYPALVVEIPELDLKEIGGIQHTFHSAYTIIKGYPRDKKPSYYFGKLNELLPMAVQLHQELFCDNEQGEFDNELDTTLRPVCKTTSDNCYGWRGYFSISSF